MKTAEETRYLMGKCMLPSEQINLIKSYGRQCAEQALKDASEKALLRLVNETEVFKENKTLEIYYNFSDVVTVDKESILSTPITLI